jgi:chromosome segregation ATPase
MIKSIRVTTVSLALVVGGCATICPETDPTKVSTVGMLVCTESLEQWLTIRRSYLNNLNGRLSVLDDNLLTSQAKLFSIRKELEKVSMPAQELENILKQIEDLNQQAKTLEEQIYNSKKQIVTLQAELENSTAQKEKTDEELQKAQQEVELMEKKLAIVQNGVKQAAAIQLKYSQS